MGVRRTCLGRCWRRRAGKVGFQRRHASRGLRIGRTGSLVAPSVESFSECDQGNADTAGGQRIYDSLVGHSKADEAIQYRQQCAELCSRISLLKLFQPFDGIDVWPVGQRGAVGHLKGPSRVEFAGSAGGLGAQPPPNGFVGEGAAPGAPGVGEPVEFPQGGRCAAAGGRPARGGQHGSELWGLLFPGRRMG